MSNQSSAVVLNDVSFAWPDGMAVLSHLNGAFGSGRTGLIGANGAGKSTLLKLISGELLPTSGSVVVSGVVDRLPQHIAIDPTRTVADLLGITPIRAAIARVEAGVASDDDYDLIGSAWDVDERAGAALAKLGLSTDLDRGVQTLSGGESMLVALTGIRLRGADVTLLDEPTNNLDIDARTRLHDMVRTWCGTVVVVSHDVALLDLMDTIVELRDNHVTVFGGTYTEYQAHLAAEQAAARQGLRAAEQQLKREKRERVKAEERIAHAERQGRKDRQNRTFVPAAIDGRRNKAEKSQGAKRASAEARIQAAREAVDRAESEIRDDEEVRIDLPDPALPPRRRVAVLPSSDGRDLIMTGPQQVGLVGTNGVGKTTLLRRVVADAAVNVGHLEQRLALPPGKSVLETVRQASPDLDPGQVRNRLARLLIRGSMVDRSVDTLSGGERFRVALARLLLADPPVQLLVLDEPTNDLDLASVDQLVTALTAYAGALLVVSHDRSFLARIGLDHEVRLQPTGVLERLT